MIHVENNKLTMRNVLVIGTEDIVLNIEKDAIPCDIQGNVFISRDKGRLYTNMVWERKFWGKLKLAIKYLFSR